MALPLVAGAVAGISGFISTVSGFFATGGPLLAFFVWIGKKLVAKFSIVTIQFAVTGAFFASKALFLLSVLNVLRLIYNKMKELLDTAPSTMVSDGVLSLSYKVMQSIGFIDALADAFSVFSLIFASLLLIYVTKVATQALKDIKDSFYKSAMLMMV